MVLEKHFFFSFSIIFQYIFQYSFLILNLSIECLELSYCVFKKVLHLKKFHIKLEKDFVMKVHYFDMIVWKCIMQNMFWHTRSLYHIKLGFLWVFCCVKVLPRFCLTDMFLLFMRTFIWGNVWVCISRGFWNTTGRSYDF